jgi:hypothetical protein
VRHGTVVVAKDASPHAWSAWIDVDAGFRMTPAYSVAVSAAPPASLSQTPLGTATVQVSAPAPHGFRITVRRAVPAAADFVESALRTNPDDITWIAALPQAAAGVRDPVPPTGPCTGPTSETEHR